MLQRRTFLQSLIAGTTGALILPRDRMALAESLVRDPYAPAALGRGMPVRIRGTVTADGRAALGIVVSDGLSVVRTDADGAFELVSDDLRTHVFLRVPAGHEIPVNPTGTAAFYQPIAPDARGEQQIAFHLRRAPADDTRHAALFLADPQTQNADEMRWFHEQTVPDVQATIARLGVPTFGVAVGDIMFDNLALYPDYERAVATMGVPFYQAVGNHDLVFDARTHEGATATFSKHFGPRYYSFQRGAVHYVVLDDVFWHGAGYIGYLGAEQLTWLANDLAQVEPGRTVIVATHIPVQGTRHLRDGARSPELGSAVTNRQALYRLLEPYRAHLITGHMHESEHLFEHGVHEHVVGAVCGAWWSGPICGDGTPNGYAIYEVNDEEVRWSAKSTGQPTTHQIRAYRRGADSDAPDQCIANVWDADDAWQITWYENGERRGAMTRRTGRDPLSVRLHTGPTLPPRRPWVEPYQTGHLFHAPAAAGTEIMVEATDRFGRTYSARVED